MDNKVLEHIKEVLPSLTPLVAPEGVDMEEQKRMYRQMCLIREFDTQVRTLWMKTPFMAWPTAMWLLRRLRLAPVRR